jgi:hypothetical protein
MAARPRAVPAVGGAGHRLAQGRAQAAAAGQAPTAAERVIAAELQARGQACDALSMMVSSVARMVQAGRCSENRWNAG